MFEMSATIIKPCIMLMPCFFCSIYAVFQMQHRNNILFNRKGLLKQHNNNNVLRLVLHQPPHQFQHWMLIFYFICCVSQAQALAIYIQCGSWELLQLYCNKLCLLGFCMNARCSCYIYIFLFSVWTLNGCDNCKRVLINMEMWTRKA